MSIHASKRSIWVSNCADFAGNEPPFGKILASDLDIEAVYVNGTPGEDPFVTPALMTRIRSFVLLACTWFVPRSGDPAIEATKASWMVTNLNPDAVMLDVETHDLGFQRAFVAEYRRLKPGRATDWTFEPRQDRTTVAVQEITDARMDLFPQMYRDNMRPADPKRECMVWSSTVGWGRFHLFLGAKQDWWALDEGALFDAEGLPDRRSFLSRTLAGVAPRRAHTRLAAGLPSLEPAGDEV